MKAYMSTYLLETRSIGGFRTEQVHRVGLCLILRQLYVFCHDRVCTNDYSVRVQLFQNEAPDFFMRGQGLSIEGYTNLGCKPNAPIQSSGAFFLMQE